MGKDGRSYWPTKRQAATDRIASYKGRNPQERASPQTAPDAQVDGQMKKDDQDRIDTFMSAYRRGDMFTQARLLHEEWELMVAIWSLSPIRHLIVGLALVFAFQLLREATGGPPLLDVVGLMALIWYGGKTIFETLCQSC